MTTEATWRATLAEVRRQALLHLQGSGEGQAAEEWVQVEPPEPREGSSSELWPPQQWQIAFEILFCQMPSSAKSLKPHQDDLLFFVLLPSSEAAQGGQSPSRGGAGSSASADPAAGGPLLVRRRTGQLPAELQWGGARAGQVDWRASVLLNLVLQTGYSLAVATCRHVDLAQLVDREGPGTSTTHSDSAGPSSPGPSGSSSSGGGSSVRQVVKVVYASPSRVQLNLDCSKGSSRAPAPCYPDVAFAVEDFDHAFSSVVLADSDDCYCVLLYAEARDSWCLGPSSASSSGGGGRETTGQGGATSSGGSGGGGDGGSASGSGRSTPTPPSTDAVAAQLARLQLQGGNGAAGEPQGPALAPAEQGQAQQAGAAGAASGSSSSRPGGGGGERQSSGGEPLVFSGFVSHQLLADAMAPKLKGGLLAGGGWAQRTSRVMMRGPGGLGGAEVAVTSMPLASSAEGAAGGGAKPGVPQFLSKLAKGVVEAAKKAAAGGKEEAGPLQLKCALMTLMVPVDMLAASILEAL